MTAKLNSITIQVVPDEMPDASYLEQDEWQDRLEAYQRGEFGFVGVRLSAEIAIPHGKDWILTTIESPGLWGIEDDSDSSYFRQVAEDELETLADMLNELNVPVDGIVSHLNAATV